MNVAVFISHPIQYFSPLWQQLAARPDLRLKVFYFSKRSYVPARDPGFGVEVAWDIDLMSGYDWQFLPRAWPTRDPLDHTPRALNRGLKQALRAQPWDAVILSGYVHLNNWRILFLCRRYRIPVLCLSDTSLLGAPSKSPLKRALKRLVIPRFVSRVSAFLPVSSHARDYFVHYGADPARAFIAPYVTDGRRFRQRLAQAAPDEVLQLRRRHALDDATAYLAFSGKLLAHKRPADLLQAVSLLARPRVAPLIIGAGRLEPDLRRSAPPGTVFAGFVNQRDLPLMLSFARALVLPSAVEPYGIVPTEALALGIPAVVSDRCGCQGPLNPVRHGESGFVFPCGDVPALAGCLRRLLDDEPLRLRLGARGREIARASEPDAVADTILRAIASTRKTRQP